MRKLASILFLFFGIIIIGNENGLAKEYEKQYSVFLRSPSYSNDFLEQIEKSSIQLAYSVEEIGMYQLIGEPSKLEGFLKDYQYIDSYNESMEQKTKQTRIQDVNIKPVNSINSDNSNKPPLWHLQWDMILSTSNGKSYEIAQGSKKTIIGIIDSGINTEHPDLKNNIVEGSINLVPKGGINETDTEETGESDRLIDLTGHGTFVAGQIAANGMMKGVAPQIGIRSYRVFGKGSSESIWIIKGIIEAAKDDVDVINLSLGEYLVQGQITNEKGEKINHLAEIKAYKEAINFAKKQGSIVVAAVGNDSLNLNDSYTLNKFWKEVLSKDNSEINGSLLDIPAGLPNVVSVSSVGPTNQLSNFSNYGKNFVDIASYGGDTRLLETYGQNRWIEEGWFQEESILSTSSNGGYSYSIGTSNAAPKVAGALGLIIDQNNFKNQPNKAINKLYNQGTSRIGPKEHVGNGILNIYKLFSNYETAH
ncbi:MULTISPECIES: S8 family serine peptidase [unclassified Lysinibacillus]|uniref:S8 family peptidase n=1 Tax=unclassified Lysinibacillus TaxID=2636778 RepID=UPI0020125EBA|nr:MULTISPECIES: S8 family serine peptidase [unclassified Lysinibacillus]MCL1695631.1 S8 family serine peptidase [Lysinibacillus sp. BPa_S21]MCL1700124.1 S8 family serine peptidase [Lysinibacillus sp. Bpr_S20]